MQWRRESELQKLGNEEMERFGREGDEAIADVSCHVPM